MSNRRSFLVTFIMGIIRILTAVQNGIAWLGSKRYRGQVIRGMEGEVFKHEFLKHVNLTPDFSVDPEVVHQMWEEVREEDDPPWETYGDIPPVPLTWFGAGTMPMDDPDSWREWQAENDPDSREDR